MSYNFSPPSINSNQVNFDQVVMSYVSRGWTIVAQLSDRVIVKKVVGVNGWISTFVMLLFPITVVGVLIWIGVSGTKTLNIQMAAPEDGVALVTGNNMFVKVRSNTDIEGAFTLMGTGWKIGYGAALAIAAACFVANLLVLSLL